MTIKSCQSQQEGKECVLIPAGVAEWINQIQANAASDQDAWLPSVAAQRC